MGESYDVAVVLNLYRPYVSGLTETAALVAEGLAARGWNVAAVATQHDPALPKRERINGVDVHRATVLGRIGKGAVSPDFVRLARAVVRRSKSANFHLPMLESGVICRLRGATPLAVTYHCDVNLSASRLDSIITKVVDMSNRAATRSSDAVIVTSHDFAASSRLCDVLGPDSYEIPPPCSSRPAGTPAFRDGRGPHIGFLGRIVEEKGLEYLVEAFRRIDDPEARLLLGGDHLGVAGGSVIDAVRTRAQADPRVRFLGFIPDDDLADFYASLDVFTLPSVNSLEAFGIVQVEAMLAGVPVVASDLPGVRVPITATGFGQLVPARSAHFLAEAIEAVLARGKSSWNVERTRVTEAFSVERTVDGYERVLLGLGAEPSA